MDKYNEWIQLVAELTVNSLNSWQWASNSVYYLLGLWSRLVSSMPYLKGESPSLLETYVPKITEAYLTSRSALLSLSSFTLHQVYTLYKACLFDAVVRGVAAIRCA